MMSQVFQDFDLTNVWETDTTNTYADKHYKEAPFTPEILAKVEMELGYKLPQSFIALMSVQNGGVLRKTCVPTRQKTSWADDHVLISEVSGIGFEKEGSLCGEMGQKLWLEEWGYPPIGVYFATSPAGAHAIFALDYRECGQDGDPKVVFVDEELDYQIIELAPNFEIFIRNLRN